VASSLKPGDHVSWETSQGKTRGKVVRKLTAKSRIKGHKIQASKQNPQYLVKSGKTGAKAAHKRAALKKT